MATLTLSRAAIKRPRLDLGTSVCAGFLLVVAFLVLYPVVLLLINSFELSGPSRAVTYSLANWSAAVTDPGLSTALINTLKVAISVQVLSIPLALGVT